MRRRKSKPSGPVDRQRIASYAEFWDRLLQIVKVEEPMTVAEIARRSPDLALRDVDAAICEMIRAGVLHRSFDESTGRCRELIHYGGRGD